MRHDKPPRAGRWRCSGAGIVGAGLRTAALTLLAGVALADQRPQTLEPYALVTQVLERNPGLSALQAAARAADSRVLPAGALPDPRLFGALAPRTVDGFTTPAGQRRGVSGILAVSQDLPWPGTLALRKKVARSEAQAVQDDAALRQLQLEADSLSFYAQWAYAHEALRINAASQALTRELRDVVENRYAAGIAPLQDVLQAEVRLEQLRQQALTLGRRQAEVRARINALLGQEPTHPLATPVPLPDPRPLPGYAALRDLALARHPLLSQLDKQLAANRYRESLARKAFYPDLAVEVRNNDFRPASETRLQIGVGLSLPLSRDKYRAGLDAARADSARLRFEREDRQAQVLGELEAARAAAESAAQTIRLYRGDLIPRTLENLSAARAAYGSGGGSFLEVITAEQQQLEAELALRKTRAEYFMARAELARWTGGELPSAGSDTEPTTQVPHE
jgi:outer membrane protein TolC